MTVLGDLLAATPRSRFRMCPYCGHPTSGPACPSHRDLHDLEQALLVDPFEPLRQPSAVGTTTNQE